VEKKKLSNEVKRLIITNRRLGKSWKLKGGKIACYLLETMEQVYLINCESVERFLLMVNKEIAEELQGPVEFSDELLQLLNNWDANQSNLKGWSNGENNR
tara:strand:+ start:633 stop:932 length:300 start_codon:yes stop_codon:yes gene_type:complete